MTTQSSETFAIHYRRLRDINEKIVGMDETSIDELLPLVEQGVESRKICQERIEAVTRGLNELLGREGAGQGGGDDAAT
jgi:hypothetical protein